MDPRPNSSVTASSPAGPAPAPRRVAAVFGSGGARGLAHLGVLQALDEWGCRPDIVVGTSIGSIAAAAYATGSVSQICESIGSLGLVQTSRLFIDPSFRLSGLISGRRVMDKIGEWIPNVNIPCLRTSYAAVATNMADMAPVALRDGPILDAIRASISIPGVFKPVLHRNIWLVDGGLVEPLPIATARSMGASRILAVDINLRRPDKTHPPSPDADAPKAPDIFEIVLRTIRVAENAIEREQLAIDRPDILLSPAVGDIGTLDFPGASDKAVQIGYDEAVAHRDEILRLFS